MPKPEIGDAPTAATVEASGVETIAASKGFIMKDSTTARIIPFRQNKLLLVEHTGEPFVPMKPVVQGMGLAWQSQHEKLRTRFRSTITEIVIVAEDGRRREMTCLPLRKLPGWLMSVNPDKVRPELRENIIAYQNECDDVLWAYWNDGIAVRTGTASAANILNSTIGTDGFHLLHGVIHGKVRRLPQAVQRQATATLWSRLRTAFNVRSAEDIPADQLDSARNFIAAYVLEGELLDREPAGEGERMKPPTFPRALPPGTPDAVRTLGQAHAVLAALQEWAAKELPRHVRPDFGAALHEIDSLLVSGWTEVDEALMQIGTAVTFLKRWNQGGGYGIPKIRFVA